jgi:hypothetical protein
LVTTLLSRVAQDPNSAKGQATAGLLGFAGLAFTDAFFNPFIQTDPAQIGGYAAIGAIGLTAAVQSLGPMRERGKFRKSVLQDRQRYFRTLVEADKPDLAEKYLILLDRFDNKAISKRTLGRELKELDAELELQRSLGPTKSAGSNNEAQRETAPAA